MSEFLCLCARRPRRSRRIFSTVRRPTSEDISRKPSTAITSAPMYPAAIQAVSYDRFRGCIDRLDPAPARMSSGQRSRPVCARADRAISVWLQISCQANLCVSPCLKARSPASREFTHIVGRVRSAARVFFHNPVWYPYQAHGVCQFQCVKHVFDISEMISCRRVRYSQVSPETSDGMYRGWRSFRRNTVRRACPDGAQLIRSFCHRDGMIGQSQGHKARP